MNIKDINKSDPKTVQNHLYACCGSDAWAGAVMQHFPFVSERELVEKAEHCWYKKVKKQDWLAAFTQHPKIGDIESLTKKFAATQHLAGHEQSGVNSADKAVIEALAKANQDYEEKFGFIFIVCATGKSAAEMLRLLQDRLKNTQEEELLIAMGEQHKITIIRLKKLLPDADWSWLKVSQITTHVLDTSLGSPSKDLTIKLQKQDKNKTGWTTFCQGVTNSDGRVGDLLPPARILQRGVYRMFFETGNYYKTKKTKTFYPEVGIVFEVFDDKHYHVPLLLNPFGYSTYRGS